ncbi:hypothetical protein C0J52_07656 [Blattella germanica]|nr:hypothetical protein C0J52_07656 [Blattella germanica]
MTLSVKAQKGLVFGFGILLLIIGGVIGGVWTLIVAAIFDGEMGLSSTSTSFGMWEETPIPMEIQVYFFDWTNAKEFEAFNWTVQPPGTEPPKPIFVERGPYIFSEHHTKVDLHWNDNDTVTFNQIRRWHFVPERSNGTLTDEITNINVIGLTVENMIRHMNPLIQIIIDALVKEVEPLYVTKTVGQLMFDGYEDELLNITSKLNISQFSVPLDKFGWFYPRNNSETYDGVFNMHTGIDNIDVLGLMAAWNYQSQSSYFDGQCGHITGYTGELFPPLEDAQAIDLFASEICSSLTLSKSPEQFSRLGLEGFKFVGDISVFDNGTKFPGKRCYCAKSSLIGTDDIPLGIEECMPSGVRGISKCKFGAPAFVSFPHFYNGDPHYVQSVKGLSPKKELHEFYIAVEPITGIPLDVKARMQINVLLQSYKNSKVFVEGMPKIMMPALWFTQSAELTSDLGNLTKLLVNLPSIGMGTFFGIAAIGALLIVSGVVITFRRGWKGDEGDKLLNDSFTTVNPTSREAPVESG